MGLTPPPGRSSSGRGKLRGRWRLLAGGLLIFGLSRCRPAAPGPNIILISIDTLRADRLGCYGYRFDTTPAMDRLASRSTVFRQAITPVPRTAPSVASILTGLYPHTHGVRSNWIPLPGEFPALAELLRNRGYRTAAIVGNYVLKRQYSGFDRGFELFDDRMPARELNRDIWEKSASDITASALRWLEENREEQFFLWLHYQDPHGPYIAPPEYGDFFARSEEDPIPADLVPAYQLLPWIPEQNGQVDAEAYRASYDREIKYCDDAIGQLLGELTRLGLDDTVIILVSDHGESLGEHEYFFEHGGFIYDPSSRVVLIVHLPGLAGPGEVDGQVSVLSIAPTLLELAGVPVPAEMAAPSLLPLLRGTKDRIEETIFIERLNKLKAVRTSRWKYIRNLQNSREELYDLKNDPGETQNLSELNPGICREMNRQLEAWMNPADRIPLTEVREMMIDKEDRKALRSLGYLH
ncbi:MAG: sulfatase [Candidatus Erginobacter occultus]|nr:sulfatase [Candidatus Erginobacter occultus]